jgi:hypothetical protein
MSATAISMRPFICALLDEVPADIHPTARRTICDWFIEMRRADEIGDHAEVVRLMRMVRRTVAQELRWQADDCDRMSDEVHAAALRRRAVAFAQAAP